jgi:hypothetical protein
LRLEGRGDLGRRLQPEKRILDHVFRAGAATGDTRCDLDQDHPVVDEGLE